MENFHNPTKFLRRKVEVLFVSSQKPHYGRKMAGIFLLAFLCIGTVELAVCKFEEPKLFEKITDPIIAFLGNTTENGKQWMKEMIQTYSKTEPIERISVAAEIDTEANNPNITKFIQRENYELLTGGTIDIIYYNQEEEPLSLIHIFQGLFSFFF